MKFLTQRAWHHAVRGTGSRYVFERGFTHSSHLRTHATGTDARNAPDAGEEPRTDTGRSKEATYGCRFSAQHREHGRHAWVMAVIEHRTK